ncbi:MAG: 16S rRNA (guanine(527)-N(7))-methyltransferase RsmG [Planctomycetota bacterium]
MPHPDLETIAPDLSPEQSDRLDRLVDLTLDANQRLNLTAIKDRDAVWSRMVLDSLTALPGLDQLPDGAAVLDLGTGGGFPGLPLAIARPQLRFTLVDATGKKADHVWATAESLGLSNTTVLQARAETLGQDPKHREAYDAVVCRAVGPMNVLLELTLPLVTVDGRLLAMKGPKAEHELQAAGDALDQLGAGDVAVFDAYPEGFDNDLVIVSILKDRRTPRDYPRAPGIPKKTPL